MTRIVDIREPLPGELNEGLSNVHVGIDEFGDRWIIREGLEELYAYIYANSSFCEIIPETIQLDDTHTAQRLVSMTTAQDMGDELMDESLLNNSVEAMAAMVCLDLYTGNTDRHGNNWGFTPEGKLVAIDNAWGWDPPITLKQALKPAYRCGLLRNKEYAISVANNVGYFLHLYSAGFKGKILADARADLIAFMRGLSSASV